MSGRLKHDPQIIKLAYDLGLKPGDNPVAVITQFCIDRVRSFLKICKAATLSRLLEDVTIHLDTLIIEIRSDKQLQELQQSMLAQGETGFLRIVKELSSPDLFAITIRRINKAPEDRKFISVIDCRGDKASRSYFSKWHELAHLLTLTNQFRLSFRRTHAVAELKDPEEKLMDAIAGQIGFFADIVVPAVAGKISFDAIDLLREQICPEASFQSAVIGISHAWPEPCILVQPELALKKIVERSLDQYSFDFVTQPVPELRAVKVHSNPAASEAGIFVYENMRVPLKSIIHNVYSQKLREGAAQENLDWWETSKGERLAACPVRIEVRRVRDMIFALIIPQPASDNPH